MLMHVVYFMSVIFAGRGGESIRHMSRASNSKILIDKSRSGHHDKPQIVTIIGTQDQIIIAKVW